MHVNNLFCDLTAFSHLVYIRFIKNVLSFVYFVCCRHKGAAPCAVDGTREFEGRSLHQPLRYLELRGSSVGDGHPRLTALSG